MIQNSQQYGRPNPGSNDADTESPAASGLVDLRAQTPWAGSLKFERERSGLKFNDSGQLESVRWAELSRQVANTQGNNYGPAEYC